MLCVRCFIVTFSLSCTATESNQFLELYFYLNKHHKQMVFRCCVYITQTLKKNYLFMSQIDTFLKDIYFVNFSV